MSYHRCETMHLVRLTQRGYIVPLTRSVYFAGSPRPWRLQVIPFTQGHYLQVSRCKSAYTLRQKLLPSQQASYAFLGFVKGVGKHSL